MWKSPELPRRLATELAVPGATRWGREYAPELSYGRHAGPARRDARSAAVAVVFCWDGSEWALPLTVRAAGLTRHGGQVSLPGGLLEKGETAREAAARELGEELGARPAIEWLGELPPLFVYASNAVVTPCVGVVGHWPTWIPHEAEVERVLKLELRNLEEAATAPCLEIRRGPLKFMAPQLIAEDQAAWGATAVILEELRRRLARLEEGLA